jgi:hypothetical protein
MAKGSRDGNSSDNPVVVYPIFLPQGVVQPCTPRQQLSDESLELEIGKRPLVG